MAPRGLRIGNMEVDIVHVLISDRAGIKLGEYFFKSLLKLQQQFTALTTKDFRSSSAVSLFWTVFLAWFWCPLPIPLTVSNMGSSYREKIGSGWKNQDQLQVGVSNLDDDLEALSKLWLDVLGSTLLELALDGNTEFKSIWFWTTKWSRCLFGIWWPT